MPAKAKKFDANYPAIINNLANSVLSPSPNDILYDWALKLGQTFFGCGYCLIYISLPTMLALNRKC